MDRWFKTSCFNFIPGKTQIRKFGSNFLKDYFAFGTSVQITKLCKNISIFVDN